MQAVMNREDDGVQWCDNALKIFRGMQIFSGWRSKQEEKGIFSCFNAPGKYFMHILTFSLVLLVLLSLALDCSSDGARQIKKSTLDPSLLFIFYWIFCLFVVISFHKLHHWTDIYRDMVQGRQSSTEQAKNVSRKNTYYWRGYHKM